MNAASPPCLADLVLEAGRGARVVWLDQVSYAARIFCPGEDIWRDTSRYIAVARQSQALLGSDVLEWRLGDAQRAFVAASPELIQPWRGRRPGFALQQLLDDASVVEKTIKVLLALQSLFPTVPRVLVVESVDSQLRWLSGVMTDGSETVVQAGDVDDGAVDLAAAVRRLSGVGLSGLVLDLRGAGAWPTDQLIELHRPLLNIARHYNWSVGALVDAQRLSESLQTAADVDLLLCPEALPGLAGREGDLLVGGGLPATFWYAGDPEVPGEGLCFGTVAEDAIPERVLARLQSIRATSSRAPLEAAAR